MADPVSLKELTNTALDKAYTSVAGRMLAQIAAITNAPGSRMQRALRKLDEEADKLAEEGERMTPDNAVLQQTMREYENTYDNAATLIAANDSAIQATGQDIARPAVTAKVFAGVTAAIAARGKNPLTSLSEYQAAADAVGFVVPTALDFATDYVESAAWASRLEKWGSGYADMTRNTVLKGLSEGWSPIYTARQIRGYAENLPKSAAESLTRTLQLTSYRNASAAMEEINGDYITGKIRVATLDDRTCLACIALHGTPLAPGQEVEDHYNGRCDVFYIVPGGPTQPELMQADSEPGDRRFVPYKTGEEWFNSLSPQRQAAQRSFQGNPAKLKAFRDGVPLSDFVGDHDDDVFGEQVVEASLIKAIGERAEDYYVKQK
jgi:hypothetical protein